MREEYENGSLPFVGDDQRNVWLGKRAMHGTAISARDDLAVCLCLEYSTIVKPRTAFLCSIFFKSSLLNYCRPAPSCHASALLMGICHIRLKAFIAPSS